MYEIENPIGKAMDGMSKASGSYGSMMKDIKGPEKPDPTVGGGAMAGMSGAVAGAQVGTMVASTAATTTAGSAVATGATTGSTAGPWGAVIGAVVGIGAYLLS